jgi:GNAT superfamily N-acetyltransferase
MTNKIENIKIKKIFNSEEIYHLTKAEKVKSIIEKEKIINRVNRLLETDKMHCYAIYNKTIPFGYITGNYFNSKAGVMISDCVIDYEFNKAEEYVYMLIEHIYKEMNDNCKYFRMFPDLQLIDCIYDKLKIKRFEVELRYSMEYEFSSSFIHEEFPKYYKNNYNLIECLNKYYDLERNSYTGSIDAKLFPEIEIGCRKKNEDIDETLCPVVTYNNELIAAALINKLNTDIAEIESISVLKSHQGRGIGKMLLRLTVTKKNEKAVNLYHKTGFETVEEFYIVTKKYD